MARFDGPADSSIFRALCRRSPASTVLSLYLLGLRLSTTTILATTNTLIVRWPIPTGP